MRALLSGTAALVLTMVSACADSGTAPSKRLAADDAVAATSKAPATTTTDVMSTLRDVDTAGIALIVGGDDYNGVGSATYTTVDKVTSRILGDGTWQLYLGNQTVRRARLLLASQGVPIPDGLYSANVEVFSRCFDQNNAQVSLRSMVAGASNRNCSFGVDFSSGRTKYKLAMSPVYPGTGRAIVTCNAAFGSSCNNWTIVPSVDAPNAGVANLYHFANSGALILDGVYRQSYSVSVAQ
jgi:hypothetical protein